MIGVNISGAEYSPGSYPTTGDLDYLESRGIGLIRLPVAWENLQPTLNGPLDQTQLSSLKTFLNNAAAHGMEVIVDLHNYGRYSTNIQDAGSGNGQVIGSAAVPISSFAGFWGKLAAQLKGHVGLAGYDIMNEPHDMGSPTVWPTAAQAAVNAIRAVDMASTIYVEGDGGASVAEWLTYNSNLHITDPANNLVYEAHSYFEPMSTGDYTVTYDQGGGYPSMGVDDIQPFVQWLEQTGNRGFMGEFGVPDNDPRWLTVLGNFLDALQADGISGTYWNYRTTGTWYNSIEINPLVPGQDRAQMAVLTEHAQPVIASIESGTILPVGGVIRANALTLSGTAASNSTISIFDNGALVGVANSDGSGNWSFSTKQTSNGVHSFSATFTDSVGVTSEVSPAFSLMVSVPQIAGTLADQATNEHNTILPFAGVTLSDPGMATVTVTVTFSPSLNGTLSDPQAAIDGSHIVNGLYTVAGSVALVQSALEGLVFRPTGNQLPGAPIDTSFTIGLSDGQGGTASNSSTSVVSLASGPSADFGGSGKSDVLWRNTNGAIAEWLMNGPQIVSVQDVTSGGNMAAPDSSWQIVGYGDFNGDGKTDILWRHQDGTLVDWTMSGSQITSSQVVTSQGEPALPDGSWNVVAVSDFIGDGKSDILWRNTGGSLIEWTMSGAQIISNQIVTSQGTPATPDSSWSIVGEADFDGDGKSDILWRNVNGSLVEWTMNGAQVESSRPVTLQGNPVGPDGTWSIAGTGDFNGDGMSDILWRNSGGTLIDWSMNAAQVTSIQQVSFLGVPAMPDASWQIAQIGDYNGDGKSDILWRNSSNGQLAEWLMNGSQVVLSGNVTQQGNPAVPNDSWALQPSPIV